MKDIHVFLGMALAICGLMQINIVRISYNDIVVDFFMGSLALIGILLGIVRFKIMDNSQEENTKGILIICILVIVNIIQFGLYFSFPITYMETFLAGGFLLTLLSFEESAWFLLCTVRKSGSVDTISS